MLDIAAIKFVVAMRHLPTVPLIAAVVEAVCAAVLPEQRVLQIIVVFTAAVVRLHRMLARRAPAP